MADFSLHPRLVKDTHLMGVMDGCSTLLLSKNALFPGFILVPHTREIEFYLLEQTLQQQVVAQINGLSRFLAEKFSPDKINVATIGNVVSQMHLHIVSRRRDDPCWPGVVWGCNAYERYTDEAVESIRQGLLDAIPDLVLSPAASA